MQTTLNLLEFGTGTQVVNPGHVQQIMHMWKEYNDRKNNPNQMQQTANRLGLHASTQ
jgi:hypothetical protein